MDTFEGPLAFKMVIINPSLNSVIKIPLPSLISKVEQKAFWIFLVLGKPKSEGWFLRIWKGYKVKIEKRDGIIENGHCFVCIVT